MALIRSHRLSISNFTHPLSAMNDLEFSKLEISDAKVGEEVKGGGNGGPVSKDSEIDSSSNSAAPSHLDKIEAVPFCTSKLAPLEVDPAELIGKTIKNIYGFSGAARYDLEEVNKYPGGYGLIFADDTKYQVRVCNDFHENAYVDMNSDENIMEDDLVGKQITSASLVKFEGSTFHDIPYFGIFSQRTKGIYMALGIKCQGSDQWLIFYGSEEDYNSDGDALSMSLYHDVYLARMPVKKGGKGGRGRGRR